MSDNELIAKFMGLPLTKEEVSFSGGMKTVPFLRWKYHESWDWLMPVVERIEGLGYEVDVYKNYCEISTEDMIRWEAEDKIEACYKAVVEFIKWYNSTKGTTLTRQQIVEREDQSESREEYD